MAGVLAEDLQRRAGVGRRARDVDDLVPVAVAELGVGVGLLPVGDDVLGAGRRLAGDAARQARHAVPEVDRFERDLAAEESRAAEDEHVHGDSMSYGGLSV